MSQKLIAPSILAADFANLQRDVELMNISDSDYLHIDIMDGQFVPNISFGFPVSEAIFKYSKKPLDFHLMILNPDQYLDQCKKSGAEIISVHAEACPHLHRTVQVIKELDCKAGVAINPHTPVESLTEAISFADLILVMSVNPGFGGQKFLNLTYKKVEKISNLRQQAGSSAIIEVDGGVGLSNASKLFDCGADMLVAGSSVFKSDDPVKTVAQLKA